MTVTDLPQTSDRRLRILLVVEACANGVGRHTLDLGSQLLALGHHVELAYSTRRAEAHFLDQLSGISFDRIWTLPGAGPAPIGHLKALIALRRIVRVGGPFDVVHAHSSHAGAYTRLVSTRGAIRAYTPNAFVTQSPAIRPTQKRIYAAIERLLAKRTHLLICVSAEEMTHAKSLGLRPKSLRHVPNGIPLVPLPSRVEARSRLNLQQNSVLIGFVGRLDYQKGLDVLIDAMPSIVEKMPTARLVVVGDGPLRADLQLRARQLGVDGSIDWLGRQPGQLSMPAFDIFVLPSRYEGFPYVALESLWAALPTVATDGSGCGELLGDSRAGHIVHRGPDEIAKAVLRLLGNEALLAQAAQAARSIAREYSLDVMGLRTARCYADRLVLGTEVPV